MQKIKIKKIVDTAMLAGKIMLKSGCEVYRIEDTMNRILDTASPATHSVVVMYTGITLSLYSESEVITLTRRIRERSTNLNRIYLVNDISRAFCEGKIDAEEALRMLEKIENKVQYPLWLKYCSYIGVALLFTYIFGGGGLDCLSSIFVGGIMAGMHFAGNRIGLNSFCTNALSCFMLTFAAIFFKYTVFKGMHLDPAIIAAIMPLVPGTSFTTAIRDTLNGDYGSGMARILESIVSALAIAVGVGAGIAAGGIIWS